MLAPLSWLKQYIAITMDTKTLGEKLTEVGLSCEKIHTTEKDSILDLEITPNRPDWLSMIGVAREVAAITNTKIKYPKLKTDLKPKKGKSLLQLKIHPDFSCSSRMTGIIIKNVQVKPSPQWLQNRLTSIGLRPINNIVDITNFVMWELGNPIHAFDYDKIAGHEMWVKQAKGGERFESVDGISYHLPKGAIIYGDKEKIFDLAGIKGGKNSGTYQETKNVFILVPVDDPVLIRRASLALGLRSDASAIFERAVNRGGTIDALKRTVDLIQETAGGELVSALIDLKDKQYNPWKLSVRLKRLEYILGIDIPEKQVGEILERLNLNPVIKNSIITCTIPTYRNDLQIEEDLIEEVARLYGYNNFPKTIPQGQIPTTQVPYSHDYRQDEKIKQLLTAAGFSEVYTYGLINEKDLSLAGMNSEKILRVDNPVSRDYEYLRPDLKINLLKALRQNTANFSDIDLFELGKVYLGGSLDKMNETYHLAGISAKKSFREIKGILEKLFADSGIDKDPTSYIEILEEGIYFELPYTELLANAQSEKIFQPIPKYPPVAEDITLIVPEKVKIGTIINEIVKQDKLISKVSLLDEYENKKTFHIVYQSTEKNLTTEEVKKIREELLHKLEKKFAAKLV